ncbi:MAG: Clp protease N-terminal domain-containing protein [Acidimicrobiia bacterium]
MPKINVYLPDELAAAVREAQLPVSGICQAALERAVRDVSSARGVDEPPAEDRPGLGLFARFTSRARKAITLAEKSARDVPHNYVGTEHALLGIVDEGSSLAIKVLALLDIELDDLRAELIASMGPPAAELAEGHVPFTPLAKRALELTTKEALSLGHNYVGCEHLLLGLLATEDGLASQLLRRMGLELRTTRRTVVTALSGFVHAREDPPAPRPVATDALEEILRRLDAIEERLVR